MKIPLLLCIYLLTPVSSTFEKASKEDVQKLMSVFMLKDGQKDIPKPLQDKLKTEKDSHFIFAKVRESANYEYFDSLQITESKLTFKSSMQHKYRNMIGILFKTEITETVMKNFVNGLKVFRFASTSSRDKIEYSVENALFIINLSFGNPNLSAAMTDKTKTPLDSEYMNFEGLNGFIYSISLQTNVPTKSEPAQLWFTEGDGRTQFAAVVTYGQRKLIDEFHLRFDIANVLDVLPLAFVKENWNKNPAKKTLAASGEVYLAKEKDGQQMDMFFTLEEEEKDEEEEETIKYVGTAELTWAVEVPAKSVLTKEIVLEVWKALARSDLMVDDWDTSKVNSFQANLEPKSKLVLI